ncbi:glycoside hydrolase family 16 protein [Flagellimonas sediminis]|uniref:Family 16 glycosylhydrolase n=1 Tax=Flagellimonas sediminis TaxID=2696468 RepID=A0A6I5KWM7_9FLAO|nr:glycoside hydrolase family 16 protein [Allomuricauda sediminis]NDV44209.1 family 16 glycosylhydrolase [Allomuricauda sediminis]
MNFLNIAFLTLTLVLSCSSESSGSNDTPIDLNLEITLVGANSNNPNGDGSGKIQVSASAQNAVRYAFRFDGEDLVESASGTIEHTFTKNGVNSYSIVAWAYSETGEFINKTVTVDVYRSDEEFATLVFSDEFEYEGSPDTQKWHHQVIPPNNGSWHNNELQHYTDRPENSFASNGTLKIHAIKEEYTASGSTKAYTSARLNSKYAFTYGRVEVRAKLPGSAGTWPAIWTLGANVNETGNYFGDQYGSVGWPLCGEIDIMEQTGWDKNSIISHFHWGDLNTQEYKDTGGETAVSNASTEFHIYSLEWDASSMKAYVDDTLVFELPNSSDKPYNHAHYLLLNIAMGGNLGGEVPANFTQDTFEIDYVRIYQ